MGTSCYPSQCNLFVNHDFWGTISVDCIIALTLKDTSMTNLLCTCTVHSAMPILCHINNRLALKRFKAVRLDSKIRLG